MSNNNLTIGLLVAIVIAIGGYFYPQVQPTVQETFGSTGSRFPNGVSANSTSPIAGQLLGTTLAVGTTSPSALGDDVLSSTGTTTLMLGSSAASRGTCFQVLNSVGALTAIVVNGTTIAAVAGSCK